MCYSCVLYVVLFKRKDYAYAFLENCELFLSLQL